MASDQSQSTMPAIFDYAAMRPIRPARKGEATESGASLYGCSRCNNTVFVTQEAHRGRQAIRCGRCAKEVVDA
jgi:DNA-directed RNA polymerase subunit RPC12/RpoP